MRRVNLSLSFEIRTILFLYFLIQYCLKSQRGICVPCVDAGARPFWKTWQYSTPDAHGCVCFPNMQGLATSEDPQEVASLSTIISLGFQVPATHFRPLLLKKGHTFVQILLSEDLGLVYSAGSPLAYGSFALLWTSLFISKQDGVGMSLQAIRLSIISHDSFPFIRKDSGSNKQGKNQAPQMLLETGT